MSPGLPGEAEEANFPANAVHHRGGPPGKRWTGRIGVYDTHMTSAALIRELTTAGWRLERVRGSHHVFVHPGHPGIVAGIR